MRYQGKIAEWNDERGFGFVVRNGSNDRVFIHISAFHGNALRPVAGDLITYEEVADDNRGRPKAVNAAYVAKPARSAPKQDSGRRTALLPVGLLIAVIVAGVWYGRAQLSTRSDAEPTVLSILDPAPAAASSARHFSCSGKVYCSEMASCEEATFYLHHCPNVKVDGDGDGIPCETQWCH